MSHRASALSAEDLGTAFARLRRSVGALGRLICARIWHRPQTSLLVAFGVGVAAAMLLGTLAISVVAREASLERALERLPLATRVVRASVFRAQLRPDEYAKRLDREVPRMLPTVGAEQSVHRALLAEGLRAREGSVVQLVALDEPSRWLRTREGRLPRRCDGVSCEGVVIGSRLPGRRSFDLNGLRVSLVGSGNLSPVPLGRLRSETTEGILGQSQEGRYRTVGGGLLVALSGPRAVAEARALANVGKTYYWTRRIRPEAVHPWNAAEAVRSIEQARARVRSSDPSAQFQAPDGTIRAEQVRGRASSRRLFLLGGQAAVVLLAFGAFAAGQRRGDVGAEWDRLRHAGARWWQLALFLGLEAGLLAGLGVLAAWLVTLLSVLLAAAGGAGAAGGLLGESVLSAAGLVLALLAWVAGAIVVALSMRARPEPRRRLLEPVGVVALALLIWASASRGRLSARELSSGAELDPILLLLPGLGAFVAAVAAARILPWAFRLLERAARRSGVAVRLALLSAARAPVRTAASVTFLTISLAMASFALGYRASLVEGRKDQAAYRTGGDLRAVESGATLSSVRTALPLDRYSRLPDVEEAVPVIRERARTLTGPTGVSAEPLELLGVSARALPRLPGWRSDFSAESIDELARKLKPVPSLTLQGDRLPPGTDEIGLRVRLRGPPLSVSMAVQRRDGEFEYVDLGRDLSQGTHELRRRIAPRLSGARVVALSIFIRGREEVVAENASALLAPLRARVIGGSERIVTAYRLGWEGRPGARLRLRRGNRAEVFLRFAEGVNASGLRRTQPAGREPVPAIVSDDIARDAGAGGRLPLELEVGPAVEVRAVGKASLFPATEFRSRFVVADAGRLFAALNAKSPGSADLFEVWLRSKDRDREAGTVRALHRAPFRRVSVRSRFATSRELAGEPLAESVVWSLLVAAALALVLGCGGLALSVAADLRDERGELTELEALGITPAALRRQLRLQAALIGAFALLAGSLAGVALTHLITELVGLSANATEPLPPLVARFPWGAAAALAGVAALLLAAMIGLQTLRSFRGSAAGRLHG